MLFVSIVVVGVVEVVTIVGDVSTVVVCTGVGVSVTVSVGVS